MTRITALLGFAAVATAQPHSQITKVITLLQDMKKQVENENANQARLADEKENQCIKEITDYEGQIKYTNEKADNAAALKENGAAKSAVYANEASELVPKIGNAQKTKKDETAAHKKRQSNYAKAEAELTESVTMLTQAYSILKRSLTAQAGAAAPAPAEEKTAFLQKSDSAATQSEIKKVMLGLEAIISSAWIDNTDASNLRSLLQQTDELHLSQPQATSQNYVSKSNHILDAIQKMEDKASGELTALKEKALKDKHSFELLSQDLTSKTEMWTEQLEQAKTLSAQNAAESEKAGKDLAEQEDALSTFKKQLRTTKAECKSAADEFAVRKTEAVEEAQTLGEAVEVLTEKFQPASLIQVKRRGLKTLVRGDIAARERVSSMLRQLSEKFSDFGFLQAATATESGDPFVKVRKMINTMIVKLEDEQTTEAAKEGKCKADTAKGKRDIKLRTNQLKGLQARADKANAEVSRLSTELSELGETVKLLEGNKAIETKERNAERTMNAAAVQEAKESIEALNSAIEILTGFYGNKGADETALIQTKRLSDKGNTIIAILETAQSDFEKIRQTTERADKESQQNYEESQQEADVSLAKNRALIEGKTNEQASFKVQVSQIDEDLGAAQANHEAATKFLDAVLEACANKPMSFEERQAKRKTEIEGLKTALEILNGE